MTQVWDDENRVVPVTVLQVTPCRVVQVKTAERDGYSALQVTFGTKKASKLTKPDAGQFEKAGVDPGPRLVELRLDDVSDYEVGQELKADLLADGDKVDVTAVSKGKGFAGVMKRHGFAGQPACHGAHRIHRAPGSIGACATPSRVFKGTTHGRPHGRREGHHPEPHGRAGRRRARPPARPGLRARPQGRPRPHPRRREGRCLHAHRRHQGRHGRQGRLRRARRRHVRHRAQRPGDAPGRHRPAGRPPLPAPRPPRPAPRCAAAAPSRGSRRAPAAPAPAPSARRTGSAVAWPSARSPAATPSAPPRR